VEVVDQAFIQPMPEEADLGVGMLVAQDLNCVQKVKLEVMR
jgi:hypothetical protein